VDRYSEALEAGNNHRATFLEQLEELLNAERKSADAFRARAGEENLSSLDAYQTSNESRRQQFRELLGWPLTYKHQNAASLRRELVAEDDRGRIFRIWIEVLSGVETYGLLLLPHAEGRFPLVVCQHGGGGTPEQCCGLQNTSTVANVPWRLVERGIAVFAPQLPMWENKYGPAVDRNQIDRQFKMLGGSAAALDVCQISRSLDALSACPEIDGSRIGMTGVSWGGFCAMVAAAVDLRIKVALSSCFFNDRYKYDLVAATWLDSARSFLDAEIAALVCPRPLCIELGLQDEQFSVEEARAEVAKVRSLYQSLGVEERFRYRQHPDGHEFDKSDGGIDFLARWLEVADGNDNRG
jgi:cephalosporin-C deacetylase-like acetyl esterase